MLGANVGYKIACSIVWLYLLAGNKKNGHTHMWGEIINILMVYRSRLWDF